MYRVILQAPAIADLAEHHAYLKAHASDPGYADDWIGEMEKAFGRLADFPLRCGLAPESEEFVEEIRHLIEGSYRILFTMVGTEVHILHVRHMRQDVLRPGAS